MQWGHTVYYLVSIINNVFKETTIITVELYSAFLIILYSQWCIYIPACKYLWIMTYMQHASTTIFVNAILSSRPLLPLFGGFFLASFYLIIFSFNVLLLLHSFFCVHLQFISPLISIYHLFETLLSIINICKDIKKFNFFIFKKENNINM